MSVRTLTLDFTALQHFPACMETLSAVWLLPCVECVSLNLTTHNGELRDEDLSSLLRVPCRVASSTIQKLDLRVANAGVTPTGILHVIDFVRQLHRIREVRMDFTLGSLVGDDIANAVANLLPCGMPTDSADSQSCNHSPSEHSNNADRVGRLPFLRSFHMHDNAGWESAAACWAPKSVLSWSRTGF